METNQKVKYIHTFRGLAILFIVASHVFWSTGDFPEIKKGIHIVLTNSKIFFLIISGFLFEYLSPKYKFWPFLTKKIKFVLLPYLICSLPIIGFLVIRFPEKNIFFQIGSYLVTGTHLGPFWYIPVILLLFLLSPIIFKFRSSRFFDVALLLTLTYSIFSNRPEASELLFSVIYYFGFFHLGMVMARNRNRLEKHLASKRSFLFISAVWIGLYALQISINVPQPLETLQMLFLGLVLIFFSYKITNPSLTKQFGKLADYSFGIYFLHQ